MATFRRGSAPGNNTFESFFSRVSEATFSKKMSGCWFLALEAGSWHGTASAGASTSITTTRSSSSRCSCKLPWCFPVRGLWFCAVFPRPRTAFWSGTSSSEISSFSMGFRSYVRHFFAAFFAPSPSFTAMVFPCPGAVVLRGLSSPKNRVLERDK